MNYKASAPNERILDLLDEVDQLRKLLVTKERQIKLLVEISGHQTETIKTLKEGMAIQEERIKEHKRFLEQSMSQTDRAIKAADIAIDNAMDSKAHGGVPSPAKRRDRYND